MLDGDLNLIHFNKDNKAIGLHEHLLSSITQLLLGWQKKL